MIRDFDPSTDLAGIRACFVELQDFEHRLEPRIASGDEVGDDLVAHMLERCRKCAGKVLVAELDGTIVGFVVILAKVRNEEVGESEIEYGLISDVIVTSAYRGQGLGLKLLQAAESHARSAGVQWLRIGVLAENRSADDLYESLGFQPLYVEREKDLSGSE